MKKHTKPLSDTEKEKRKPENALPHILYEIEMLLLTIRAQQQRAAAGQFEKNLLIESFVVHARNLDEFFRGHSKSDRMKPNDFGITTVKIKNVLGDQTLSRMNAEICHLGYNRKGEGESWTWDLAAVADPLKAPCQEFLEHILTVAALVNTPKRKLKCEKLLKLLTEIKWPSDPVTLIQSGGEIVFSKPQ